MTEHPAAQQNGSKKGCEKKDEDITMYADGKDVYHVGDTVYIESQRPDMPYFICSIRDFKRSKKDNITVDLIWYYRPCEIPTSVYQLLLQDRNAEYGSSDHVLDNPIVKNRELFISDAIDVYPAHALRGHAHCAAFADIKENVMEYINTDDNWFYILRYNPESRRMANAKGEIKIGVSHQACLPSYIPYNERNKADLKELHDTCKEELVWDPSIQNSKLLVYLRAACSITSYSDYCDGQEVCPEKKGNAISEDQIKAHSYDTLHKNRYNISEALQELIRTPAPKVTSLPMTDEERKKFMRGLRSYGKTFHKIRKELLPERATAELVQYYYIWKKTASAISSRPHKRGGRRNNALVRKTRTTKPKTAEASEFLDLSSCSENEFEDSEDSENARNFSLYACRHCYTTESTNWHHAGKPKVLLCYSCRLYFKRYGHMKPVKEEDKREAPPFIYKAAFENIDESVSYSGRMRTRRSSTPVFAPTNKTRQLLEGKISNRKQITTPSCREETPEQDEIIDVKGNGSKRKTTSESEQSQDAKRSRVDGKESDAEDADDESDGDSEIGSIRTDSNTQKSNESSRSHSPLVTPQNENIEEQIQQDKQAPFENTLPNEFVPIKIEEEEEVQQPEENQEICSPPSSPEVPDDPIMNAKIAKRFLHNQTQNGNSCSRCERIYTFKRKRKELEGKRREESYREREIERRQGSPPLPHQPAQITSHYETMRLMAAQRAVRTDPHRYWHGYHQQLPPEVHGQRPISPREYLGDPQSKFSHLLKALERPDQHRGPHTPHSMAGHQIPHPAHPFTQRSSDGSRDLRISPAGRTHLAGHVPNIDNLSRGPPGIEGNERVSAIDRPMIDPLTGLPHVQPHVHSHLHTHTHLHVHPDEIKYRGHPNPPDSAHFERHERAPHPTRQPSPAPIQHRPGSISRDYHEHLMKQYPDLVAHLHHDPHLRESMSRHIAPGSREGHIPPTPPVGHESAVSPSIPHEMRGDGPNMHSDPVAYHLWLTRMHHRWNSHGGQPHPQAPELSPHGMPHQARHPHEMRSEHDKHINEKIFQAHAEREKLARADHLRSLEHDKHLRHILQQSREAHVDPLKMKGEHGMTDRQPSFRPPDIQTSYNSHFNNHMESLRRSHDSRPNLHERNLHDPARYGHDRIERERMAHLERVALAERFPDRARHERASIFGHYKPHETIDLSED